MVLASNKESEKLIWRVSDYEIVAPQRGFPPMVAQFIGANIGIAVYINPAYVMSLRPDPKDPDHFSVVTLQDGESIWVKGGHEQVAARLSRTA